MEICITVILKEVRGFDRTFQLMYQPNPIWTQNEEALQEDNTHIGFNMEGRFKELLSHCKRLGYQLAEAKECVVAYREEIEAYCCSGIEGLLKDIKENGYMFKIVKY